jgi:hypothetical protein
VTRASRAPSHLSLAHDSPTLVSRGRLHLADVKRTPVVSSMMASVGYDAKWRVLEIEFRSGDVYEYVDVPPEVFHALRVTSSKGRLFNARIDRVYRSVQIERAGKSWR